MFEPIRILQLSSLILFLLLKYYYEWTVFSSLAVTGLFLLGTLLLEYLMENNWVWIPKEKSAPQKRREIYQTPIGDME